MNLRIAPPYPVMEAKTSSRIPEKGDWQYEPKWDGFRCLAFRDEDEVYLQSKAGQPLSRYFPEVVAALAGVKAKRFVLDGEIMVPDGDTYSFDALLQRIHPAASRVKRLSSETPAVYVIFDLLVDEKGTDWTQRPLRDRREKLEAFFPKYLQGSLCRLSMSTNDLEAAREWWASPEAARDGVVAKQANIPYASGLRTGMVKVKRARTSDCVVGGFRYQEGESFAGSLLLGLYGDDGLLHHVGFTSSFKQAEKLELTRKLEKLKGGPGFTGRAPGGPSRWATEKSTEWVPLKPELVVEVSYDHFTNGRFRHGTRFLRWRPDKAPSQCTFAQISSAGYSAK